MMLRLLFWCALVASVLLAGAEETEFKSSARWIWYPEAPQSATRILKSPVFEVKKPLRAARLYIFADDSLRGMAVNGKALTLSPLRDRSIPEWQENPVFELKDAMTAGKNVIAFTVWNGRGIGGVIARLELIFEDGTIQSIVTGGKWLAARESAPEEFVPVRELGDFQVAPWARLFMGRYAFGKLLTADEERTFQAIRQAEAKRIQTMREKLEKEPLLPVKIDFSQKRPQFVIGSERHEAYFFQGPAHWQFDQPGLRREIRNFADAGMHLYGMGAELISLWKADGSVDIKPLEEELLKALLLDSEAHFLIGINEAYPAKWWKDAHPDELVKYANGEVDTKTAAPMERYNACSMASELWRQEFAGAVAKMVSQLETSPVGKRIFAYRVDYGVYHEWHYYGMGKWMPDTGKAMQKAFRAYLTEKYPSDKALQNAWGKPGVTRQTAEIPDKAARLTFSAGGDLRDPVKDRAVIDYLECMGGEVAKCLETVDAAAKRAAGGRVPVGNYFGYFWGMGYPAEGWHLALDKVLESPSVDFCSFPSTYGNPSRNPGMPGEVRALTNSFGLHGKLAIIEADTRTHKTPPEQSNVHAKTAEESVGLLSRDYVQALTRNTGMWHTDFGQMWLDDPAILNLLQKQTELSRMDGDRSSVSEAVLVGDFESVPYHATVSGAEFTGSAMNHNYREIAFSGAPFDMMLFSDLARAGRDYKVYVFVNLLYVTPEKAKVIADLKAKGKTVVLCFAPGYLTPHGADLHGAESLTGMKLTLIPDEKIKTVRLAGGEIMDARMRQGIAPFLAVTDPAATALGTSEANGKSAVTFAKKANCYFTASGHLSRTAWREILRSGGVHLYSANPLDVIYANSGFVALHAGEAGAKLIELPHTAEKITMLLPEKREMPAGKTIQYSAKFKGETALFRVEK